MIIIGNHCLKFSAVSRFNLRLERVRQFRQAGKTLMCVSHATGSVQEICDLAIWPDHGEHIPQLYGTALPEGASSGTKTLTWKVPDPKPTIEALQ